MQSTYTIAVKINACLAMMAVLLNATILFIAPWLIHHNTWWALLPVLLVLLTSTNWAIIHEAIHGIFSPNRKINEIFGRILCISVGNTFHLVRFGHLMHHQYNRSI